MISISLPKISFPGAIRSTDCFSGYFQSVHSKEASPTGCVPVGKISTGRIIQVYFLKLQTANCIEGKPWWFLLLHRAGTAASNTYSNLWRSIYLFILAALPPGQATFVDFIKSIKGRLLITRGKVFLFFFMLESKDPLQQDLHSSESRARWESGPFFKAAGLPASSGYQHKSGLG